MLRETTSRGQSGRSDPAGCSSVCVLLLQDLLQRWSRGGRRRVEDMCYERLRAEACVDESAHHAQCGFELQKLGVLTPKSISAVIKRLRLDHFKILHV